MDELSAILPVLIQALGGTSAPPMNFHGPSVPVFGGQNDAYQSVFGGMTSASPPMFAQTSFNQAMLGVKSNGLQNDVFGQLEKITSIPAEFFDMATQATGIHLTGGGSADLHGGVMSVMQSFNPLIGTTMSDSKLSKDNFQSVLGGLESRFMRDGLVDRDALQGYGGTRDMSEVLQYARASGNLNLSGIDIDASSGNISESDIDKVSEAAQSTIKRFEKIIDGGKKVFGSKTSAGEILRRAEALSGPIRSDADVDLASERLTDLSARAYLSGANTESVIRSTVAAKEGLMQFGVSSSAASEMSFLAMREGLASQEGKNASAKYFSEQTGIQLDTTSYEEATQISLQNQMTMLGTRDMNREMAQRFIQEQKLTGVSADAIGAHYGSEMLNMLSSEGKQEFIDRANTGARAQAAENRIDYMRNSGIISTPKQLTIARAMADIRSGKGATQEQSAKMKNAILSGDWGTVAGMLSDHTGGTVGIDGDLRTVGTMSEIEIARDGVLDLADVQDPEILDKTKQAIMDSESPARSNVDKFIYSTQVAQDKKIWGKVKDYSTRIKDTEAVKAMQGKTEEDLNAEGIFRKSLEDGSAEYWNVGMGEGRDALLSATDEVIQPDLTGLIGSAVGPIIDLLEQLLSETRG